MLRKIEEWRFGHGPESGSNERERGLMRYCPPHDVQVRTLPSYDLPQQLIFKAAYHRSGLPYRDGPPSIGVGWLMTYLVETPFLQNIFSC